MGHALILTEKPTAAEKMANALADGKIKKFTNGKAPYYRITRDGKDIYIVPAVGHLFVLAEKDSKAKWVYPVFDVEWKPGFIDKDNAWSKVYYDNILKLSSGADEFFFSDAPFGFWYDSPFAGEY